MTNLHRSPKLLACCLLVLLLLAVGAAHSSVAAAYAMLHDAPAAAAPARLAAGAAVRSGPGERYLLLTVTPAGEDHAILGRSGDGLWWRIDFRGQPAWVAVAQVETRATDVPIVRVGGERL